MALLKSLIQRLLDSRTTPAQAVHADRPNINAALYFSPDTFTAPRDGFVRVWTKVQADSEGTALSLHVVTNGGALEASRFAFIAPTAGNSIVQTWPVLKGETIRIGVFNLNIQALAFYDAIGGGYQALKNALLQGGVLCRLSRLYSSLRRSSCRVRRNGLLNKAYRPLRRKLPSASVVNPLEEIGLLSPRPTTVSFALWPTQTRSLSKTMLGCGRDNRGHKDTQEPMLCAPRVALSRINWDLQRLLHPLFVSLFLLTAPLDSAVGGASC